MSAALTHAMDRRAFITMVGGSILTAPLVVEAQSAAKVPRIGVMAPGSPPPESSPSISAFAQGLRDLGWVLGQNITLEYRWTEDREDRRGRRKRRRHHQLAAKPCRCCARLARASSAMGSSTPARSSRCQKNFIP